MAEPFKDCKDYCQCGACGEGKEVRCVSGVTPRSVKTSASSTRSSSSSSVGFSEAFGLPPPPDGGWGWFVVLGSFLLSLICDGCAFSFGVIYVHLLNEFKQSKSYTAWVASIFYCLSLVLGPVASALTRRFGCRPCTVVAGVVAGAGFVASSFVTSIWQLYITFSIVVGASFSICYVTSVLTVAYYFDKRRALATGLSVCGSGIGTFTFAPLCEWLACTYGWRGAFQILGAICLNICVCGALFRPLKFTREQRQEHHLNVFNRLARPVSRLSIPSRNRSRLHSTNSESTSSSTSDSEDDTAALAFSQLALPTYVDADKELVRMYLDKLPELKRSGDPQIALQRFFKSKAMGRAKHAKKLAEIEAEDSNVDDGRKGGRKSKARDVCAQDGSVDEQPEEEQVKAKRRRRKPSRQADRKEDADKSLQQVTEKLLESSTDVDQVVLYTIHDGEQCQCMPVKVLERSQSDKTPSKVQCNPEKRAILERASSEKIPAHMQCRVDAPIAAPQLKHVNSYDHSKSRLVDPANNHVMQMSCSRNTEMSMMLSNKHSTFLILHRNDIFFRGSFASDPMACATSCPELSRLPSSDSDSEDESRLLKHCPKCAHPFIRSLNSTFDKDIVTHPLFLMLALSNFLLFFWADIPYLFAADFAISKNIAHGQATFLLSIIGIVNTVGQIIYGLIGDQDWNQTIIYGISCIGSGLAILLLPISDSYWLMAVLCGLFGFFVSANYSLMTVLLVGYFGLEKLAHAIGLIMMTQGLANLGGPPVAGALVDQSGNYEVTFPVAGGFIMMSGMILFLVYIVRLCSRFLRYCRVQRSPQRWEHKPAAIIALEKSETAV